MTNLEKTREAFTALAYTIIFGCGILLLTGCNEQPKGGADVGTTMQKYHEETGDGILWNLSEYSKEDQRMIRNRMAYALLQQSAAEDAAIEKRNAEIARRAAEHERTRSCDAEELGCHAGKALNALGDWYHG